MTDEEKLQLKNEYENKILEIIDHSQDFTRSDLQGIVSAIIGSLIADVHIIQLKKDINEIKIDCKIK